MRPGDHRDATESGHSPTIRGFFAGTLQAYQQSLSSEPYLILTALVAVYIVSAFFTRAVHPLTIISTLLSQCRRHACLMLHEVTSASFRSSIVSDRHCEKERHHDDDFRWSRTRARHEHQGRDI